MSFFLRILLGLVIVGLGFLVTWKTQPIVDILGYSAWAEQKLGSGGTYTLYKLIGVIIIFIGIAVMVQLHEALLGTVAGFFVPDLK